MSAPEYRQLVAVHHPRYGTGIKRKNAYLQQWMRRQKARLEDQAGQRAALTLKSRKAHPGRAKEQADG